jgi:hypothetical protein
MPNKLVTCRMTETGPVRKCHVATQAWKSSITQDRFLTNLNSVEAIGRLRLRDLAPVGAVSALFPARALGSPYLR